MSPSSVFHPLSSNCASCCGGRLGTRKRRRLDSQATNAFIPPLLIGALPSDRSRRLQNPPRSEPTKSHACILKASVPYFSIMLKGSRHDAPETRIGRVDEPGRACRRRRPDARPARRGPDGPGRDPTSGARFLHFRGANLSSSRETAPSRRRGTARALLCSATAGGSARQPSSWIAMPIRARSEASRRAAGSVGVPP